MKLIQHINQNIPIWSVLKGDHACGDLEGYLNPKLITHPDFLDKKENALRAEYLRSTKGRNWLFQYLHEKSFALVEIEEKDVREALTVWKNLPLLDIAKEYKSAYALKEGFEFKKVKKSRQAVCDVYMRRKELPTLESPVEWLTSFDQEYDYHRSIWMKRATDGKLQLIDGTHRTLATVWKYLLDEGKMPKKLCALTFNE